MPAPTFAAHTLLAVKNFTAKGGGAILEKFILENWRKFEVRFDGLFWISEKI